MKKILNLFLFAIIFIGVFLVIIGVCAMIFTYQSVASEKIITPDDSAIPNTLVCGPLTLKAQADIIRRHVLKITDGKTFAQMPMMVAKLDEAGKPILDKDGNSVMVQNSARDIWITATALRTALYLGLMGYVVSGLVIILGLMCILNGLVWHLFSKKYVI